MAKLSAKKRNALRDSSFAGPDRSYPINDVSHARQALRMAAAHDPKLLPRIKAKIRAKWGHAVEGAWSSHK